jgi:hypothetical protein
VSIVIEPLDEPEDASPAAEGDDSPEGYVGAIARAETLRRPARRGSSPSASWIIAAAAAASALAVFVAVPAHDRPSSAVDSTTTPAVAMARADLLSSVPDRLIMNPVLVAPCRYLFDVAADALLTDADSYGRSALSVSGTQGRSLNDVARDDLAAVRAEILRLPIGVPGVSARVEALDVALARANAAPCSLR